MDGRSNRVKRTGREIPAQDKRGSSIVSVITAFALLLLGISLFYTAMTVSLNLIGKAQTLRLTVDEAMAAYYTQERDFEAVFADEIYFESSDEAGSSRGFAIDGECRRFTYRKDGGPAFVLYAFIKR